MERKEKKWFTHKIVSGTGEMDRRTLLLSYHSHPSHLVVSNERDTHENRERETDSSMLSLISQGSSRGGRGGLVELSADSLALMNQNR